MVVIRPDSTLQPTRQSRRAAPPMTVGDLPNAIRLAPIGAWNLMSTIGIQLLYAGQKGIAMGRRSTFQERTHTNGSFAGCCLRGAKPEYRLVPVFTDSSQSLAVKSKSQAPIPCLATPRPNERSAARPKHLHRHGLEQ